MQQAVDRYIAECFRQCESPQVKQLAQRLGIARSTLLRRFKDETGIALSTYFMRARVRCARRLLRTTQLSLRDVRCRSGFREERAFFRVFLRATGMTPQAYRRQYG